MKDWVKELEDIMTALRNPDGGCPWDLKQNHETLKEYMLEECSEFLDAVDEGDYEQMKEELGDILLNIAFHCQLAKEKEKFNLQDVAQVVSEKMIRRHPHVFAASKANSPEAVIKQWEKIKKEEKGDCNDNSVLDGVPGSLPALAKAQKIQKKAAKVNFDWPSLEGPISKLLEETEELKLAINQENQKNIQEEIGDLLFAIVNISRHCKIDAEDSLRMAINKFKSRFEKIEAEVKNNGKDLQDCTLEELDEIWNRIKG